MSSRGAMERGVSVNDGPVSSADDALDLPALPAPPTFEDSSQEADLGPCLYFGPAGERCDRRALEGGFCARHRPGASRAGLSTQVPKRAVAAAGVLAALWPILADLIRELIRLLR